MPPGGGAALTKNGKVGRGNYRRDRNHSGADLPGTFCRSGGVLAGVTGKICRFSQEIRDQKRLEPIPLVGGTGSISRFAS
jgi:hypothetical protein